ncbi:MAG: nitroreductase family deazaflavin-dependent oxidoreductase [Porticoccaceae bacterium]
MDKDHIYFQDSEKNKDAMEALPDQIKAELAAHLELYQKDPEAAHYWDTAKIGLEGVVPCLMLTVRGAKSGIPRQNVLQYYRIDDHYVIVGSRGGTVDHPIWYINLRANPDCEIQVGKLHSKAIARTLPDGPERDRYWKVITEEQPIQAVYQKRTSRLIPVVVLDLVD